MDLMKWMVNLELCILWEKKKNTYTSFLGFSVILDKNHRIII